MKNFLLLVNLIFFQLSIAQEIRPTLDRATIIIGEPIKYKAKIDYKEGDKIIFPVISDSLNYHITVLNSRLDTIKENEKSEIVQNLDLTSFDTGKFIIPSITIQKNGRNFITIPLEINVKNVKVDTTKNAIFPIKNIMNEEFSVKDYWNKYWIYGIIALVLFIIAVILIVLYIRSKSFLSKSTIHKTPYEEAKASLISLDAKNYLRKGEQKEYYTQLSFILRRYLSRVYNFSALELLSDDLLTFIAKKEDILPEDIKKFKQFLFDSDLVKFAKQTINNSKNEQYRKWVEEFIDHLKPLEIPLNEDLKKDQETGDIYKQFNNN